MNKWKIVSVVLAVLLFVSVGLNVVIFQAADRGITKLQEQLNETKAKVIPGVYLYGNQLTIKNGNISDVYFNPAGVYVLDRGKHLITEHNDFDLDAYVVGLYPGKTISTWKVTPGVHYVCVNLSPRDSLRVTWKVVNGSASDWIVRLFNETGFEVYKRVITNYQSGNPNSEASLLVVQKEYQLMGSTPINQKEGGFTLGWDHNPGKYCIVFENWGDNPLRVELTVVVEKHVKLVDNG